MLKKYFLGIFLVSIGIWNATSQVREISGAVFFERGTVLETQALSEKVLLPPTGEFKIFNPKESGANKVVPGKGLPKIMDPVWQKDYGKIQLKGPSLVFDAATSGSTPTDPTGAVGPNHYVNAWNSAFAIYDKQGNVLLPPAALASIGGTFLGEDEGDPIVVYDSFADRFLITQFSFTPNSFLVAISKGPDPVNDGWYTYRFKTGDRIPDYPKFSVWSDGYYITTNKQFQTSESKEVVYVLERDKMLQGEEAQMIGFPLPGLNVNAFYSPAGFFAVGEELPPKGNAPIIYFQDDSWEGVNQDHLKIWLINVDWENPENSTIEESQVLGEAEGVAPFISTFDGGSFKNLSQAGEYPEIDALQGALMYMTMYRRFPTHNSVVMNFVVDIDPSPAEHAGIRWYELRQEPNGGPWSVYQQGTYAPDESDRFCGSIGIDKYGNIGMGFTVVSDNPVDPVFPTLRYTGRFAGDELNKMTIREISVVDEPFPNPSFRYGDYAHLTIDPVDDATFWYIGEYFANDVQRKNKVAVFKLEPEIANDVGIAEIIAPRDATLGNAEEIKVAVRNYGLSTQTTIPVQLSIDGGETFSGTYSGTLIRTSEDNFTFSTKVDLSNIGQEYEITAWTNLPGDQNPENDTITEIIENLEPRDVGVISIDAPITGLFMDETENVTVTLLNFGGRPQSDIPISYSINNGPPITEVFEGTVAIGEAISYTFNQGADISEPGIYEFYATTVFPDDAHPENDDAMERVANLSCIPEGSNCFFGDGISDFYLGEIKNENIPCNDGYIDFMGPSAVLDRSESGFTVSVETRNAPNDNEKFSMWIDFNDNGVFEDVERVITSEVIPEESVKFSYDFQLSPHAALGEHVLRVRAGDTSYDAAGQLNAPCSVMSYGTTHDYSVVIVDSTANIDDLVLAEADLIVSDLGDDIYYVSIETNYEGPLFFTVHDLLGQKLVEHKVEKTGKLYQYQLNMSYAATGVYLVRLGTRKVGKVAKIIVQ